MASNPTDPKPCERCGQTICPTLPWNDDLIATALRSFTGLTDSWTAAFQACGTMKQARETEDVAGQLGIIVSIMESRQ